MKILFIHLCAPYNEGWTYRENILPKYLVNNSNEVIVLTTKTISNLEDGRLEYNPNLKNTIDYGIEIIKLDYIKLLLPFPVYSRIRIFKELFYTIKNLSPDLIYINGLQFVDLFKIIYFKKITKDKRIIIFGELNATQQNSANNFITKYVLHKLLYRFVIRSSLKYIDGMYFGSGNAYEFSVAHYGIENVNFKYSPLGVDEMAISNYLKTLNKNKLREKFQINRTTLVYSTGGRLDSKKNVLNLMKAFERLQSNSVLMVFGEVLEEIETEFYSLLEKSNNVIYLGWLNDLEIYELYFLADLAIFPGTKSSLWEVATAISLPIFAQYWPGLENIDFGGNLKLYNNLNSEQAIFAVLNEIENNINDLDKMRDIAQIHGLKNLSYKKISEMILLDYEEMVEKL